MSTLLFCVSPNCLLLEGFSSDNPQDFVEANDATIQRLEELEFQVLRLLHVKHVDRVVVQCRVSVRFILGS